jgi:hypothetical protein
MSESEKEVYANRICAFCTKEQECAKDKFKIYDFGDKRSYRCMSYEYKLKEENFEVF